MSRKTEIVAVRGSWKAVLNAARWTIGKEPLDKEPSDRFKKKILIAEHSPIRELSFVWVWRSMPHWVSVHWVRHKWEKFVRTQRTDRTGSTIPRSEHKQGEPQDFMGDENVQNLIDTDRKRLCFQASPETRAYAEDQKKAIKEHGFPHVSGVLVPNCVYRCGCPEMQPCGRYAHWCTKYPGLRSADIQERYDAYNELFWNDPDFYYGNGAAEMKTEEEA